MGSANYGYYNLPGDVSNKGIEFSLAGKIVSKKDFSWTATLNVSFNKNVVNGIPQMLNNDNRYVDQTFGFGGIAFGGDGNATNLAIVKNGLPLGAFWGYQFVGVNPANGNALYKTAQGGTTEKPALTDQTYLGSGLPTSVYGFMNTITYKSFSLDFLIDAVNGNQVFNATRIETEGMYLLGNQTTAVLARWRKSGDVTDVPAPYRDGTNSAGTSTILPSSRFVENGAFLRLKSISLSYRIRSSVFEKNGIQIRLFANAQNLFTLTDYKGYYPEVNAFSSSSQNGSNALASPSSTAISIDYGTYPQMKTFTGGINLTF